MHLFLDNNRMKSPKFGRELLERPPSRKYRRLLQNLIINFTFLHKTFEKRKNFPVCFFQIHHFKLSNNAYLSCSEFCASNCKIVTDARMLFFEGWSFSPLLISRRGQVEDRDKDGGRSDPRVSNLVSKSGANHILHLQGHCLQQIRHLLASKVQRRCKSTLLKETRKEIFSFELFLGGFVCSPKMGQTTLPRATSQSKANVSLMKISFCVFPGSCPFRF